MPLLHLAHEQKLHDILVTEKSRYCSSTVSNIIAYEKILVQNLQEMERPLFDVNALNLFLSVSGLGLGDRIPMSHDISFLPQHCWGDFKTSQNRKWKQK